MSARVGLLLVGHVDAKSVHIGGDYPELYADLFAPVGLDVVTYRCDEGQLPGSVDECDGWICSPSRSSVYDDLPWLRDVEDVLREVIAAERPFVGICFGHQLLAQALGGRVEKAAVGWGLGVQPYDVVQRPAWMPPNDQGVSTVSLIASHQDQVVELPDDAELWATADYCPNAGFGVGERAWTIQTHPEFTAEIAASLLGHRVELLGADVVERALASLAAPTDRELVARWVAATIEPKVRS